MAGRPNEKLSEPANCYAKYQPQLSYNNSSPPVS